MRTDYRPAQESDAEAIQAIYSPFVSGTAVTFEAEPPDAAAFRGRIREISRTHPWLVAVREDRVVGYAYASPHRARAAYRWCAEISVYLAEGSRREGIGRGLYDRVLECLRRQGYYNVYAGITLPNEASVGFHEALGFRPVGVYPNIGYKLGRWHDVGWWHLALAEHSALPPEPVPFSALT